MLCWREKLTTILFICGRQRNGLEHNLWSYIVLSLNFAYFTIVGKVFNLSEFVSLIAKCGGY